MDYYRRLGVESIHGGLVAMRRRTGNNWVRIEELPDRVAERLGESVLQKFQSRDLLESHLSDQSLLSVCPRLAPDIRLEEESVWSDGRWSVPAIRLRQTRGLPNTTGLSTEVAEFLARFDGSRTVHEVVREVGARSGVDPTQVQQECLKVVRLMIDRGFLLA